MSHSPGQLLGCACTVCTYGQIPILCITPSGSPCPHTCVKSYTSTVLICFSAYNVIDHFVSIIKNLHLLFCLVLSILVLRRLVLMVCVPIRRDSIFLSRFPFLCHVHVFFLGDVAYSLLKTYIDLLFVPLLFSGCCSRVPYVVSIVSGAFHHSFSSLFYVISKPLY